MPKPQRKRDPLQRRSEAPASRGLVMAETFLATVVSGLFGAILVFAVNLVIMLVLWIAFRNLANYSLLNELGLGLLMSSTISLVAFGLMAGYAMVPARIELARMYTGFGKDTRTLADTVRVRGRVDSSPYFPATMSTITIGSIAVLAGIVCATLLVEATATNHDPEDTEALFWSSGLVASIGGMLLCLVGVVAFRVLNRRWEMNVVPLLPKGASGSFGKPTRPASGTSAKRIRKTRRQAFTLLDWCQYASGVAVTMGLIGIFASVFIRQPERYGPEVFYASAVEGALRTLATASGILLFGGLISVLATGGLSTARSFVIARRVAREEHPVSLHERRIARTAAKTLTDTSSFLLSVWFALPVLAFGWYCARDLLPDMNGRTTDLASYPQLAFDALVPVLAWLGGLAALVVLRAVVESRLPGIRNRVGYELPIDTPEGSDINFR